MGLNKFLINNEDLLTEFAGAGVFPELITSNSKRSGVKLDKTNREYVHTSIYRPLYCAIDLFNHQISRYFALFL